ncbi:hypothetical protein [Pseudoalteromonas sp. GW168-MNA-CIBAN-0100]|uniref:hypothetical protein n=1 Tax=Pseudoalteromonas sp. GW168-MNA-CIBAN-0100 TaxID=3140434 RepID=UPI00332E7439
MSTSSKSRSSQATSNTSTSLGVQGDNTGFMTVGNGNNYNITQTDGGLVDALGAVWGDMAGNQTDMIDAVSNMSKDNADMTESITRSAFDYGRDVNSDSLNFAGDTVRDSLGFGSDSLAFASDAQDNAFKLVGDTTADAFNFGRNAIDANSALSADSIKAQNYLAETSIKENSDLARSIGEMAADMHGNNTAFANNSMMTVVDAVGDANKGMTDLAYYSIENNSNLAADLAAGAVDKVSQAFNDAGDQTILAHKQAMQFAENASRSDGQQLAISTNKSMTYIVIGLGGIAILAMFMGRK